MSRRRARTWKRRLLISSAALLSVFAVVTVLVHLPAVQAVMGWRNPDGTGACPFGHDRPRIASPSQMRTGPVAPARPALGFVLAATSREDVLMWARANRVKCAARKRSLECSEVPAELLADHGALLDGTTTWFELDDTGMVHTIKIVRRTDAVDAVAHAFSQTRTALQSQIGAPALIAGSPRDLARGAFQQATVEHRYADYRAQVRATNMGNGYVLTESYAAL